ncbi:DEAD/DEAH box helicase [Salinarchaeum laminariae]|uniref:DEAD/DEAH box helicase n=1 Tax=Salinarchaeum laminariae TaxID=869888 RepID=UPI0020C042EC|nr:DEAD/DEAH box helicase [Salinarchaeum laminariae]
MEVAEVLPNFADAFAFEEFNAMQRAAIPGILETDHNLVASAPTASGKTAIAELAICKTLDAGGTALFVAPMRALTNEKERDWERFEELGYSVYVVTGERDLNPRRARRADILVMTPEKVDSATRKHDTRRYDFVTDVETVVVDEVHLLDSERRGSALEVTVSRLRRLCDPRIVALSATMPNVEEVAEWLDAPDATTFDFDEDHRPVELNADVKTYSHGENSFADKYRRLYRALDLAQPHLEEDGQSLVFVASRQDTQRAAAKARDELAERDVRIGARGDYDFHTETERLEDDELRQGVLDGVAYHHAGLSKSDRDLIEQWFREGQIELLFSTSTLAWGVNLPARCVIIRDTKYHDPLEGEVEMSPLDVLQMLGRAGRPGYDDVGYGWVVTDRSDADRYRRLLREGTEIHSNLSNDLPEHLLAEVCVGTIESRADALEWLDTTFYAVRADGVAADDGADDSSEALAGEIDDTLASLAGDGFLDLDGPGGTDGVAPTALGRLASQFYLRLETARGFHDLATRDHVDEAGILRAVATAVEFDDVAARSDEADAIDAVLGERGTDLPDGQRKILAILRAAVSGATPASLRSDAWIIRQNALRMLAALGAVLEEFAGPEAANECCRLEARIEHGVGPDAAAMTAIDGVGEGRAQSLAKAGFDSPVDVAGASPTTIAAAGVGDGVAERIVEAAAALPRIEIEWGELPSSIAAGERTFCEATIRNRGGGAQAGVRVTVNDVEMTADETYLSDATTVPVACFGADANELELRIQVVFPELPIDPIVETRTVSVE